MDRRQCHFPSPVSSQTLSFSRYCCYSAMFDFLSRSQEPPPSNTDTVLCTSMDLMTEGLAMTFCLYIPSSLDHNKLKTAVFHAVETKLPRAGARLGYRNGVSLFVAATQVIATC